MKVTIQEDKKPEKDADLFALGNCLGLQIDNKTFRIALSPTQWKLLASCAEGRGGK